MEEEKKEKTKHVEGAIQTLQQLYRTKVIDTVIICALGPDIDSTVFMIAEDEYRKSNLVRMLGTMGLVRADLEHHAADGPIPTAGPKSID